jgi:hypothetical protein
VSQRIENDAQVLQYCRAGVSDRFLEQLIGRDRNTLNRVLETCSSRRSEKGPGATTYWIYDLQEVVQRLVEQDEDAIVAAIRNMKPEDMPVRLQKDFWAGQRQRLEFEEAAKNLWRTERVEAVYSEMMRLVRQQITLFENALDQQDEMSGTQRKVLHGLVDGLLDSLHRAAIEHFAGYEGNDRDDRLSQPG